MPYSETSHSTPFAATHLRDVVLEFLRDDRAALPAGAAVLGREIQPEGTVGREPAIAEAGDAEQRIEAGLLDRDGGPGLAAVLGADDRTAVADRDTELVVLERDARQRARHRRRDCAPRLPVVVRHQREAALADGHEAVTRSRDVHQDDAARIDVDDDPGAGAAGLLGHERERKARACDEARCLLPSLHGGPPRPSWRALAPALAAVAAAPGPRGPGAAHRIIASDRDRSSAFLTSCRCGAAHPAGSRSTCPSRRTSTRS